MKIVKYQSPDSIVRGDVLPAATILRVMVSGKRTGLHLAAAPFISGQYNASILGHCKVDELCFVLPATFADSTPSVAIGSRGSGQTRRPLRQTAQRTRWARA